MHMTHPFLTFLALFDSSLKSKIIAFIHIKLGIVEVDDVCYHLPFIIVETGVSIAKGESASRTSKMTPKAHFECDGPH